MPSRPAPIWVLTGVLLSGFPVLNSVYWPYVLRSGSLAPDGDSIGIPLFGSIATAGLAAPFVLGLTWLCLRRYSPATRVLAFRRDRPLRSILATLILGGAAVLLAIECVTGIVVVEPWYEYLWPIYTALVAFWLMALRAAAIEQD